MTIALDRRHKRFVRFFTRAVVNSIADIGVRDHDLLTGLGDDDHTQYLHLNKAAQTLQQALAVTAGVTIDGFDISADLMRVLGVVTATAEVVNSAALTSVLSVSIPGGTLGTDRQVHVWWYGDYLNNAGAGFTIQVTYRYGGNNYYVSTALEFVSGASRRPFSGEFHLYARGATNSQGAVGRWPIGILGADQGAAGGIGNEQFATIPTVTTDSTVAQNIQVMFQHSAANANLSARLHAGVVFLLP